MDKIILAIFDSISRGGPETIFMILIAMIAALIFDRVSLVKTLKETSATYRSDINNVIQKYQDGQISQIEALNDIKLVLVKIEAKV